MVQRDALALKRLYEEAKQLRAPYEPDMRAASAYCLPAGYSSWQAPNTQGGTAAARRIAYDSTGVRSLPKYVSTLERLATPQGQRWQKLEASDPSLMKVWAVRDYFDKLTDKLFKMRYSARANFIQTSGEVYTSIGVYGMGPQSITWRKPKWNDKKGGFRYKAWSMRDIFILVDDMGNVCDIFRRFWLNADQFKRKFPTATAPAMIASELAKPTPSATRMFEFFHHVCERDDYDNTAIDMRRQPIRGEYVSMDGNSFVGEEEGFSSWPYQTPRVFTEPGAIYGYAPAAQALPALGGLSAMKKSMLKIGHKAADPPLLAHDDGVISGRVDMRPGHVTFGALDSQGRRLVQEMVTGANFPVVENMMQDERHDVEDSFFVTLFTILTERPQMTATQVIEEVAQKASLLSPTMGRLQSEYLGPMTEREIALMAEYGVLDPLPPELMEAKGSYEMVYTSPLAKGLHAEEVASYFRLKDMLIQEAGATGNVEGLDWLNDDVAIPQIADYMSVRTGWVATDDIVQQKRATRAQQQQQREAVQAAPAAASVATAAMANQDKGL